MIKYLALILINFALGLVFFVLHRLVTPSVWVSVGLALGTLWYLIDEPMLFPRYQKLLDIDFPLSRSFWLLLVFWPLAIFVLTSTGSWLAQGLMVALGVGIGIDLVLAWRQPDQVKTVFHFPAQSKWQMIELRSLIGGWIAGLVIYSILLVI